MCEESVNAVSERENGMPNLGTRGEVPVVLQRKQRGFLSMRGGLGGVSNR